MKRIEFSKEKDEWLKKYRTISFNKIIAFIKSNKLLAIEPHQNTRKYPNQNIFVIKYKQYIFSVPFIEDENKIFLKTIYASRKLTKKYLKGKKHGKKTA